MYAILNDELYHHGIKGQHWGIRRFQNSDGSLTTAGSKRYGYGNGSDGSSGNSKPSRAERKSAKKEAKRKAINEYEKILLDTKKAYAESDKIWDEAKKTYKSLGPNAIARIKEVRKAQKGEGSEAAKKYLELYDKSVKVSDDAFDRKFEAENNTKRYKKSIQNKAEKEINKAEKIQSTKDAVKAYQKAWNKSIKDTDAADDYYRETVKPLYDSLAKTKIGRVKEVIKAQRGKGSKAANEYLKAMDKAIADRDKADASWKETKELYKKTGKNKVSRVINNAKYDTGR